MKDQVNGILDGLHVLSLALWGAARPDIEPNEEARLALAGYADRLSLKAKALSMTIEK